MLLDVKDDCERVSIGSAPQMSGDGGDGGDGGAALLRVQMAKALRSQNAAQLLLVQ